MPSGLPHNPYYLQDLSPEVRASAALAAAGAYDAAPTVIQTTGMDKLILYITYTRGAVGGAVTIRPEYSPRGADEVGVENWFQQSIYEAGAVAAGADTASLIQRENFTYQAVGATAENFIATIDLDGAVERVRVPCAESGVVGTPGECHIIARLM